MHHRRNRSQGGLWTPPNLMHLCHEIHMWITAHPAEARRHGWAIRAGQDPAVELAFLPGIGWCQLNVDGSIRVFHHDGGEVA
jgi:hypothetical protein